MIKLIGFRISGHSLFKDNTHFTIATEGQTTTKTMRRLITVSPKLMLNRTIGIVGINATGKTTLMDIFQGLQDLYLLDLSIDQTTLNTVLRGDDIIQITADLIDIVPNSDNQVKYRVKTTLKKHKAEQIEGNPIATDRINEWTISDEEVYSKIILSSDSRTSFFDIDSQKNLREKRSELDENQRKLLSNKDSIFRAIDRSHVVAPVFSTTNITNRNVAKTFADSTPVQILRYLDSSVEYFNHQTNAEGKTISYTLKFIDEKEEIVLSKFSEVSKYLSSGTVRGITLFYEILNALRTGATLFIDELELHVNKQIARDFISFFSDSKINKNGATLVYSTHYIELVDDLKRKDELYVLTRDKKTSVHRYSTFSKNNDDLKIRDELKKSEIFQTNRIKGTAPSYNRLIDLQEAIISHNSFLENVQFRG